MAICMSHPELLGQKFQNREGRGQSLLPGRGVSPQKLVFLFLRAAAGGTRGERKKQGTPLQPRQRARRPLQSRLTSGSMLIELMFDKFGMTHARLPKGVGTRFIASVHFIAWRNTWQRK